MCFLLYLGIVPRIMRIAPACAIMISTYEFFKTFFRDYNAGQENMTSQQHDVTSNHSQTSVADSAFSKSERWHLLDRYRMLSEIYLWFLKWLFFKGHMVARFGFK